MRIAPYAPQVPGSLPFHQHAQVRAASATARALAATAGWGDPFLLCSFPDCRCGDGCLAHHLFTKLSPLEAAIGLAEALEAHRA